MKQESKRVNYVEERAGKVRINFEICGKYRYRSVKCSVAEAEVILSELLILINNGKSNNKQAIQIYNSCRADRAEYAYNETSEVFEEILADKEDEIATLKEQIASLQNALLISESNYVQYNRCQNQQLDFTDMEMLLIRKSLEDYHKMRYSGNVDITCRRSAVEKFINSITVEDNEALLRNDLEKIIAELGKCKPEAIVRKLAPYGLTFEKKGKHYAIYPIGRPELSAVVSATPSCSRNGENQTMHVIHKLYK